MMLSYASIQMITAEHLLTHLQFSLQINCNSLLAQLLNYIDSGELK